MISKWKYLPVKWKWRILFSAILLLFIVSYEVNIRKTIGIVHRYNMLVKTVDTLHNENTIGLQDEFSKPISGNSVYFRTNWSILDYISSFCEGKKITVKQMMQTVYDNNDSTNYSIETNKMILEGSYAGILELIYDIENQKKIASVSSIKMELTKDKLHSNYNLLCTIYIKYMKYGKD